jgi:Holliday junction resolvase RusA-like endonuclease
VISLWVPGEPVAMGRPRATRHGAFARVYTPGKSAEATAYIVASVGPVEAIAGPVSVVVDFYIAKPKKKVGPYPMKRPDLDNLVKLVMDALTKANVWADDNQVVRLVATKRWAESRGPGTEIYIEEI